MARIKPSECEDIRKLLNSKPQTVAEITSAVVNSGLYPMRHQTNHTKHSRDWTRERLMHLWKRGKVRIIERPRAKGGTMFVRVEVES